MTSLFVNITDQDGVLLCRHEVNLQEIVEIVDEVGLKHGELRGARAVIDAASEVGSAVTDEIIAAISRVRLEKEMMR